MLSVVIIEDEQGAMERLQRLLKPYADMEVTGRFDSVDTAFEGLMLLQPDLVFMDVEIKGGTCFDLLKRIGNPAFDIIFATAYNQYAVQAFEYSAVHYLLKPIDQDQLAQAVNRCLEKSKTRETSHRLENLIHNLQAHGALDKKIAVPTARGLYFYKLGEVVRFEADGNYCKVVLSTGDKYLVTKQLKHYEALLDKRHFFRTHQSHLVHMAFVDKYIQNKSTFVKLSNGDEVPVSVRRRNDFFELLNKNQQI